MSRKLLMNTDDPYNIDGMKVMTRGKEIDWDTYRIKDNPNCWVTVDAVTVVSGQQYSITTDGAWWWVVSYDDNDNFVSDLLYGDNPLDITFTPDTNHIRFEVFDSHGQLTYCTVKAVL